LVQTLDGVDGPGPRDIDRDRPERADQHPLAMAMAVAEGCRRHLGVLLAYGEPCSTPSGSVSSNSSMNPRTRARTASSTGSNQRSQEKRVGSVASGDIVMVHFM
jgi:hypothetical protein